MSAELFTHLSQDKVDHTDLILSDTNFFHLNNYYCFVFRQKHVFIKFNKPTCLSCISLEDVIFT